MNLDSSPTWVHAALARVADPAQLAAAWADVLAGDREDGVLGRGVARFAEDADEHLARIAAELRSGTYEPGQLTPMELPRPAGLVAAYERRMQQAERVAAIVHDPDASWTGLSWR